ncbi:MAG: hypothetical protein M0T72_11190 [Candidatus Dormibacteraeota bacterium]|nr:hypothetical protein [Candidatus Dormibacteraeota bacterium]
MERIREFGIPWVAHHLRQQLGIDRLLRELPHPAGVPPEESVNVNVFETGGVGEVRGQATSSSSAPRRLPQPGRWMQASASWSGR